jgi:hypothetical protein
MSETLADVTLVPGGALLELDLAAQVKTMLAAGAPDRLGAGEDYRATLEIVGSRMGAEFAARYDASLQELIAAMKAPSQRAVRLDWWDDPKCEIPACYVEAAPGTHEALVGEMIKVMGREAVQLNMSASMARILLTDTRDGPNAAEAYRAHLATIERHMGGEFAQRYDASVKRNAEALRASVTRSLSDWVPPEGWLKPD